ncbi:MAG: hypothetical protein HQ565_00075 [Bacteroidetes bacterium]|nr:hypothetical protein [Bacteroidota bacterium]
MNSGHKLIFFMLAFWMLGPHTKLMAQCTNCQNTTSSHLKASSAIGLKTKATGYAAFASGSLVIVSGEGATGIGSQSNADGDRSFTLGSNLSGLAQQSFTIGNGFGIDMPDRLLNNFENSLMIGFNSIYPTLFISTSDSKFRTGTVGIGNVTEPQAKLHIRADQGEPANLFIEQSNFRNADLLLGNLNHGIRSTDDNGLIFRTEKNYVFNEGAVGINTFYPTYDLDVQGSIFSKQFTLFDHELYHDNIEGWVLRSDAEGHAFWTNPSQLGDDDWIINEDDIYRLKGNVGLGTSNPVAQLDLADIYTAGGMNLKIGNDAYLTDVDQGHILGIFSQTNPESGAVKLGNSGPVLFGVDTKVGIGTKEPSTTLELNKKLDWGGNVGLCIANDMTDKWFIGMDGNQKHSSDLLIGKLDNLSDSYASFMVIKQNGNVGIGTGETHSYKLAVDGAILTEEVTVKVSENWPDYVFHSDYELLSLDNLNCFINNNGHLPGIPSTEEVTADGIKLGEMDRLLLLKIEELTLYIIKQDARINEIRRKQTDAQY